MSTLRQRARRFWREYTRMRTAIFFLIGVVLIVLVGSFVPQQDTSQQAKVDEFLSAHTNVDDLFRHFGLPLTEVFVSPLFLTLLGSLYIALGACVIRRGRALVMRTIRRQPRTTQYWGEWGSWLFHTSFFLLLVAVVWGKSTGYQGLMLITEGQQVTEARSSYDQIQEGLLFDGQHAGYQVRLNHFTASYASNGAASDFVSNVTVYDHGSAVLTKDIRVNDFLGYRDVDFYQQDYGWAPHIVVRNPANQVVYDGYIQCFAPPGGASGKSVGACVLKVPDFGYTPAGATKPVQIGANVAVFPDAKASVPLNTDGSLNQAGTTYLPGGQVARNPVLEVQVLVGDLSLTSTQNVNALDSSKMVNYFDDAHPVALPLGQTLQLPLKGDGDRFTISFPDLKQYSLFMVKKDNGVPLVYATFGAIMTGLMLKLYIKPAIDARRKRRRTTQGDSDDEAEQAGDAEDAGATYLPSDHVPRQVSQIGDDGVASEADAVAAASSGSSVGG